MKATGLRAQSSAFSEKFQGSGEKGQASMRTQWGAAR